MSPARFKIVFDGELLPEVALETAKDNLARLFKSDRTRINSLFCGRSVAIKRDLQENEADQYLAALHRAGAKARKEPDPGASLCLAAHEPLGRAVPDLEPRATADDRMTCPKCLQQQRHAAECAACGIIIDKYLARQAQLAATVPSPAGPGGEAANSPYSPPKAAVTEAVAQFGELRPFTTEGRIGRLRYLAWSLALLLCTSAIMAAVAIAGEISPVLGGVLTIATLLGTLVVSVQIGAQRLHDIGWSAWLLLLNLVPLVNSLFWLLLLIVPGSAAANRFGPPPPANSVAVKLLAGLFLALSFGVILSLFLGGFAMLGLLLGDFDPATLQLPSR